MNKTSLLSVIAFACIMLMTSGTYAQKFAKLDTSPLDIATFPASNKESNKSIKIVYSRPQLKGRQVSTLAKNGEVWRTGANEATNIILYKDMKISGKPIKAGEYSLFTIPGEKEWTVILSKDINVWGAYTYNKANDVIRVSAPVSTGEELEAFSIAFSGDGTMHLGWGTIRVAVPFSE